ncbi:2-polyprenyl-3-methyl-5-hydroxy-6-metoxy-1,4-benzoquinol methylase [Paenibacillus forsythiae]|uniref:2-polyprenyl-3-methyl-5-hydroxy-6-metoxy-1, 4-benzoquinol methylase n=1 Tax=Paenibacillus forsythiae TaxID=365616 RepID=A0ABU3HE77_9BACL|nr:class I SAM-dependent methyltransferase [Paenibacillus forsythiae]MDT3429126.1 2-polyprenyl-3-methyl-5-hydroxy-6-metoxy-1,4-benzoquinol methylase [Paenibacillus forsythiae]
MKIHREPMLRYGEKDFDEGYIHWGFDEEDEQIGIASQMLSVFQPSGKDIIDIACGLSRYHKVWLDKGYNVTGVDLSETFIEQSAYNNRDFTNASYRVQDINHLDFKEQFDIATWIDPIEITAKPVRNIFRSLRSGGMFIYEMWNENFGKYKQRYIFNKTWTFEEGIYKLIRHEYNHATSTIEHEEIYINTHTDEITIRYIHSKTVNTHCTKELLLAAGFDRIEMTTWDGKPFDPVDDTTKRFLMVGYKD